MASIKYKDNGEYKDIVVKVGDTLPIGTIIGFDTTQTIPNGWEYYAENQIKKIAPVTPPNGLLENTYGTSQTNGYSQEYINDLVNVISATTTTLSNYFSTIDLNIITITGKVVQFAFRGLVANAIPGNTSCISGFPIPYIGSRNAIQFNISDDRYPTIVTPYWGFIAGDGTLKTSGIEAGKWVHINITYITTD